MKAGLGRCRFIYLMPAIFAGYVISPGPANANQIAQGFIQLAITALAYPTGINTATCEVYLFTLDPTTSVGFSEDVTVQGTVTNNVVTCTVVAPYYWSLTALTGTIATSYTVSGQNGTVVTKSASGGFDPIPVSTTGTTPLSISTVF